MDPITQGILGAATSEAVLFSYDKKRAWIVGGLSAMAPDLDILIQSKTDPLLFLIYHRQFSHALCFIPIGAFIVAAILWLFKPFRSNWRLIFMASFIGYITHAPLDILTSYGTVFFWPFSHQRLSLDIVSIVDPFFTFPLAIGLSWTLIFNQRRGVLIGLLLAALFIAFNTIQHQRTLHAIYRKSEKENSNIRKARAFPTLASSTRWHGLYQTGEDNFVFVKIHTPLFQSVRIHRIGKFSAFHRQNLPSFVKNSPTLLRDFNIFNWFTDGYLIVAQKNPLHLVDGRYLMGQNKPVALWGILFNPNQAHIEKTRRIALEPIP
ncbi:metal-dependent hydrolase [Legionella israelensis]|uniref:metal-dependent hydrolase n=1 Tax=Legionella israelensis TaxID=454 RepID=UPI00117D0D35|nr:metal-dependent hydrolase [Legionella israelensis]QDP71863.1 metal-dependent hydrolase [Legionella israelensis]